MTTGKVGDRKSVKNDKSDKNDAYCTTVILSTLSNDKELNLSYVGFVTFDNRVYAQNSFCAFNCAFKFTVSKNKNVYAQIIAASYMLLRCHMRRYQ